MRQLKGRSSPAAERLDNDTSHQHSVPMCPDLPHVAALPCRSVSQPCHCLRTVESLRDVAAAANAEDTKRLQESYHSLRTTSQLVLSHTLVINLLHNTPK